MKVRRLILTEHVEVVSLALQRHFSQIFFWVKIVEIHVPQVTGQLIAPGDGVPGV